MNAIQHIAHTVLSSEHGLSDDDYAASSERALAHFSALAPNGVSLEDVEADAIAASEERVRITKERQDAFARMNALRVSGESEEGVFVTSYDEHQAALAALDVRETALYHALLASALRGGPRTMAEHREAAAKAAAAAEVDRDIDAATAEEASADTLPPTDVAAAFAEVPSHADGDEVRAADDDDDIPPLQE